MNHFMSSWPSERIVARPNDFALAATKCIKNGGQSMLMPPARSGRAIVVS
jgi:hypothetical protein